MKDAQGHGSNAGAHAAGIVNLPKKLNRAHFEQIAETLRAQAPPETAGPEARAAHAQRVSDAADRLATTNPGFSRERFIAATAGKSSGLRSRASSRTNAAKVAGRVAGRL